MTAKVAYLWGPISSFAGPLAAALVSKGWQVQIATKSSLNLFSLSPLDLHSSALVLLEQALGGRERFKTFQDRLRLVDDEEGLRGTSYDAIIFCGLPPNFDEPRAPRAPWAASRLPAISKALKGVPIFIVSSLWGGVQADRVVPEEFEFERRKPATSWESQCQHYELRLVDCLSALESSWYLVRVPLMAGTSQSGDILNFSGLSSLFKELDRAQESRLRENMQSQKLRLAYNPDSTLWFLPSDTAVHMFMRFLEDETRPRICNFVSTQATLNREWMHYLAKAFGEEEIVPAEHDSLNLSGVLRRLLMEDVQVKTRNLFEVAGRYQLTPTKLDKDYFERVLQKGRESRWGGPVTRERKPSFSFSEQLAQYYFEEFLPSKFSENLLKKATTGGTTIGFLLKGANGLGWVIKAPNGAAIVERLDPSSERPRVCFHFTGKTMIELIQSKLPLHRALLMREVQVEGPLLQAMRVTNIIEQFLRQHPVDTNEVSKLGTV